MLSSGRSLQGSGPPDSTMVVPMGDAWIKDAYAGMQLTTFSGLRLRTLVSLGQHLLATMTPPGPAALQQKNPSGQQVVVP